MKSFALFCIALMTSFFAAAPSRADTIPWADDLPFGFLACAESPCVVQNNPGGIVEIFMLSAKRVKQLNLQVVIKDYCESACTLFADKARPNVCITRGVVFLFHKQEDIMGTGESVADYAPDIMGWVNGHGGFPPTDSPHPLRMSFKEALGFWPLCKPSDLK